MLTHPTVWMIGGRPFYYFTERSLHELDQNKRLETMFETILNLRKRLPDNNLVGVTDGDYSWTARFDWQPPCSDYDLKQFSGRILPKDYLSFLSRVSNGCTLYYDVLYGQWGFKIYGLPEIVGKQELWKASLENKWRDSFFAFAELYGEAQVLLFDLSLPNFDLSSFTIKEGNPYDNSDDWPIVSGSFHEWLDHLIAAQGVKYWERKTRP